MAERQSSYDLFLDTANRQPNAVALLTEGKNDTSFGELSEIIKINRRVLASWGIERGSRVGLLLSSLDTMVTAYHAITSCAIAVPLNPNATEDEILFDLHDFKVRTVIVEETGDSRLLNMVKKAGVDVILLRSDPHRTGFISLESGPGIGSTDPELPQPEDVMALLHTSGTTARPKIIPMTHISRVAGMDLTTNQRTFTPPGRSFNALPLHHGQGLIGEAQLPLMTGSSVYLARFEPRRFIKQISDIGATWFSLVPSMHQQVVVAAEGQENIFAGTSLRYSKSTSAGLPLTLLREMRKTYGVPIIEWYAAQECSTIVSTGFDESLNREGSVGKVEREGVLIMDEHGNPLLSGESGEVCVKLGPIVITGYEDNPEATAEAFRDGFYHTGDGGYIDEDGYLFLTGRIREIINRGGEKISPVEIDEKLSAHPAIALAAAFGAPSERTGEEVMAAVVLRPGHEVTPEELRAYVAQTLSFAKVPKRVFIVDELPLNTIGKIMRRELAQRLCGTV